MAGREKGSGALVFVSAKRIPPRREVEAVMRRVFTLSTREQLLVYKELRVYLGAPAALPESKAEKEAAARRASLEAMSKVAAHLGRPDGAHIKADEYAEVAKELGLPVSVKQVRDAWGRWREANRVFAGGQMRESPTQRGMRRTSSGKRRKHETPFDALHEWLTDEYGVGGGEPVSFTTKDYENYRAVRDPYVQDEPLLPEAHRIVQSVGLVWDDCIACARGEADSEQLREARLLEARAKEGPLGLIGGGEVARMLGLGQLDKKTREQPGFPVPVAVVGSFDAWVSDDVRTFQETGRAPERKAGSYQSKLYDLRGAAAKLGYHVNTVRARISDNSDLIPQPEGRVGTAHYWRRKTIDTWEGPKRRHGRGPKKS